MKEEKMERKENEKETNVEGNSTRDNIDNLVNVKDTVVVNLSKDDISFLLKCMNREIRTTERREKRTAKRKLRDDKISNDKYNTIIKKIASKKEKAEAIERKLKQISKESFKNDEDHLNNENEN